ncbi:MAG TPA: ABC transporter ATP-binding protein [Micromonosporaceae bacterium]|nr:ABC transporter ATP-binding protein [Micromonosporaceae bacterium]
MSVVSGERVRAWLRLASLLRFAGSGVLAPTVILAVLSGLLPTAFIIAMGRVMLDITTDVGGGEGMSDILGKASANLTFAFIALIGQQLVPPFQEALAALAARRIDRHALTDLLSTAMQAPLERVEEERAVSAVAEVSDAFMRNAPTPGVAAAALPRLVGRYLQLISAVVLVAVVTSWYVAVLLTIGAIVIRYGQRGSLDKFSREWALLGRDRQRMNYLQAFGTEPTAAKEIRVLGLLGWLRSRYDAESEAYLKPLWRRRRAIYFRPFLVYTAIGFIVAVTAFVVLGKLYSPSQGVVALAVVVQAILVPLRFGVYFPECDDQTLNGLQYQGRIDEYRELLRQPVLTGASAEPVVEPNAAALTAGAAHEIRFTDVHFRYPEASRDVLNGLDLVLEPGRSTALVGVNGAGKTTLVKLLSGGYPPTSGMVLVDGHDLRTIDPRGWCREVAVIFQNFVRFDLSMRENLLLGAAHLAEDHEAMMDALVRANAHDILEGLPAGLDTVLSPEYLGGTGLSGGQWQRVALARAFYAVNRGATVLVLDEPTAQLDVRSEIDFYERFLELTEGLTTLVISHRFSTVRRADTIAVLEHGRISELGSHDSLMAEPGTYASMFRTQADRFSDAVVSGVQL